jgi:hypothetical protein
MVVCTTTSEIVFDDLLDVAAEPFQPSDRGQAGARRLEAGRHAVHQLLDRTPAVAEVGRHLGDLALGLGRILLRQPGTLLDLRQRRRGLVRGGSLLLGPAIDLAKRRHDLARRTRQFLDRRRQLLRRGADLLGRRGLHLAGSRGFRRARQLLRRALALIERLGLLADRRLGFVGRPRLLFRRARDQHGALLGLAGGAGRLRGPRVSVPWLPSAIFCMSTRRASSASTTEAPRPRFADRGFRRLL